MKVTRDLKQVVVLGWDGDGTDPLRIEDEGEGLYSVAYDSIRIEYVKPGHYEVYLMYKGRKFFRLDYNGSFCPGDTITIEGLKGTHPLTIS